MGLLPAWFLQNRLPRVSTVLPCDLWRREFHILRSARMKNPSLHIEINDVDTFKFLTPSHAPVLRQLDSTSLQKFYFETRAENTTKDMSNMMYRNPKYLSTLNHLRFYLPELYQKLHKILFLDDDVAVQKDLTALWKIDMDGEVNGAVETCFGSFQRISEYLNFFHPLIKEKFNPRACAWAFGVNMFDLDAWRREKCTDEYYYWQNLNEDRTLWKLGTLPLGLFTFHSNTKSLDKACTSWVLGSIRVSVWMKLTKLR